MMSKKSKIVSKLQAALDAPSIHRISRKLKMMDRIDGFVVGLSESWVLVAREIEGGYSDGLVALRVRDVTNVDDDPSFATRFALTQPPRDAARVAAFELTDVKSLIASAGELSPIVAVELEKVAPGALWIGRYEGRRRKRFRLLLVNFDASWDNHPTTYHFKDVTTVAIDSRYHVALLSIAGKGPGNAG